ncbi:MAG: zinc-ribbon domain-containing protein [Muribaculaceae bacterium]|nr:zinc-ribbon domain-containing protein [Muribaculaceae bacterium]
MADFDIEFCPHCGKELKYIANTCSDCGEDLPSGLANSYLY